MLRNSAAINTIYVPYCMLESKYILTVYIFLNTDMTRILDICNEKANRSLSHKTCTQFSGIVCFVYYWTIYWRFVLGIK